MYYITLRQKLKKLEVVVEMYECEIYSIFHGVLNNRYTFEKICSSIVMAWRYWLHAKGVITQTIIIIMKPIQSKI